MAIAQLTYHALLAVLLQDYAECSVAEKERIENVLIWLKMRFRVDAPDGKNPNVQVRADRAR
jgi:hypothetical protein